MKTYETTIDSSNFKTENINVKNITTESVNKTATTQKEINEENVIFLKTRREQVKNDITVIKSLIAERLDKFNKNTTYEETVLVEIEHGVDFPDNNTFTLSNPISKYNVLEFYIYTSSNDDSGHYYYLSSDAADAGPDAPAFVCTLETNLNTAPASFKYKFTSETEGEWSQYNLGDSAADINANRTTKIIGISYGGSVLNINFAKIAEDLGKLVEEAKKWLSNQELPEFGGDGSIGETTGSEVNLTDEVIVSTPLLESISYEAETQNVINEEISEKLNNELLNQLQNKVDLVLKINNYFDTIHDGVAVGYTRKTIVEDTVNSDSKTLTLNDNLLSFNYFEIKIATADYEYVWLTAIDEDSYEETYVYLMINEVDGTWAKVKITFTADPKQIDVVLVDAVDDLERNIRIVGINY